MTIDADSPDDEGLAYVTATFTMRNLGDQEEKMDVRFPLYYKWNTECNFDFWYFGPSIADFQALVDGVPVESTISYETFTINDAYGTPVNYTVACWANFPVTFPIDRDVIIQVTYTAEPYQHGYAGANIYSYILVTGAGWKDTIGTADIIIQMPYELNHFNFFSCWPKECEINGTQVVWHFEDLEPDFQGLELSVLPHNRWYAILHEQAMITKYPNDGEAWGRLGKAYKESIMGIFDMRYDAGGRELFVLSAQAYEKALELLPGDADWHYGYAELLCQNVIWRNFDFAQQDIATGCVDQLRFALEIDPNHEKAKRLLEEVPHTNKFSTPDSNLAEKISVAATAFKPTPTRTPVVSKQTKSPDEPVVPQRKLTATSTPAPLEPGLSVSTPVPAPLTISVSPVPTQLPSSQPSNLAVWLPFATVLVVALTLGLIRTVKKP
jgi:hypothetical protein